MSIWNTFLLERLSVEILNSTPLEDLVIQRLEELERTCGEVARRKGYINNGKETLRIPQINKHVRKLAILRSDLIRKSAICRDDFVRKLADAADVGLDVVESAVDELENFEDAILKWWLDGLGNNGREEFKPHAYIHTKYSSPLFYSIFHLPGEDLPRHIYFEDNSDSDAWVQFALDRLSVENEYAHRSNPISYISIHYSPDYSENYDLEGNLIEKQEGTVEFLVSGSVGNIKVTKL